MKASRTLIERVARLHTLQAGRCFYCACHLTLRHGRVPASPSDATIDHFIPLARGGAQGYRNWVLACMPCNQAKAHRLPTREEMAHWNVLAAGCAYMQPIDLQLEARHCIACGDQINPLRVAASRQQGREARTCRRGCRPRPGYAKRANQTATVAQQPAENDAGYSSWWQRLLHKVTGFLALREPNK